MQITSRWLNGGYVLQMPPYFVPVNSDFVRRFWRHGEIRLVRVAAGAASAAPDSHRDGMPLRLNKVTSASTTASARIRPTSRRTATRRQMVGPRPCSIGAMAPHSPHCSSTLSQAAVPHSRLPQLPPGSRSVCKSLVNSASWRGSGAARASQAMRVYTSSWSRAKAEAPFGRRPRMTSR